MQTKQGAFDFNTIQQVPTFRVNDCTMKYFSKNGGVTEDEILAFAKTILNKKFTKGVAFTSPNMIRDFLIHHLSEYEHEVFCCVFLDSQNRMIAYDEMFTGTVNSSSVYPREIVKRALKYNATALIFAHNHPSGLANPSQADKSITNNLKTVASLLDIRILDHFIVGGTTLFSFAEAGLL